MGWWWHQGGPGDDRPDHWSTPVPYHAPASGGPFMPDLGPPAAGRGAGGEEEGVAEASRRLLGQFEVVMSAPAAMARKANLQLQVEVKVRT